MSIIDKPIVKTLMLKGEKGDPGDLDSTAIVDNLTTNRADKVLSAKQGKVLKDLVDANKIVSDHGIINLNSALALKANTADVASEYATKESVNDNISSLDAKVNSLASGSPLVASSISDMTDTTRSYVLVTDGHWYWYDGDSWEDGGVYQATSLGDGSVNYNVLSNNLKNKFKQNYKLSDMIFYNNQNNFPSYITDNVEWKDGYALNSTGNEQSVSGYSVAYFSVEAGDVIVSSISTLNYGWAKAFVFYNNNTFLSYQSEALVNGNIIIPNNCNKLGITVTTANKVIVLAKLSKQLDNFYIKENLISNLNFINPLRNSMKAELDHTNCVEKSNTQILDDGTETTLSGLSSIVITNPSYDDFYIIKGNIYRPDFYAPLRFFDENNNLLYKCTLEAGNVDNYFKIPSSIQNVAKVVIAYYNQVTYYYGKIANFSFLNNYNIKDKVIYCAGDSLTVGYNGATNSYVDYVADFYQEATVVNRGHNGWTASGLLPELCNMRDKQQYYPEPSQTNYANCSAVIINMGTNGGVSGSIASSIPQIENATDLEDNALSNLNVTMVVNSGIKYNGNEITTASDYWNLFSNDYYGNVALTIEYIQWQNPCTQIFLLPPCISSIQDSANNSAYRIFNAMKELAEVYGIEVIDINNSIGINRRNEELYRIDYVHGTNKRNEMVGKFVGKYISNKIYK